MTVAPTLPAPRLCWVVSRRARVDARVFRSHQVLAVREGQRSGARPKEYDFVVCGGGTSGCYLASLLCARYPQCSVCLINLEGNPPWWTSRYIMNLVGVVLPTVPSVDYSGCRLAHKRQFRNCTWLGGNSNINAGVCPLPTEQDVTACLGKACVPMYRAFRKDQKLGCDRVCRPVERRAAGMDLLSQEMSRKLNAQGGAPRARLWFNPLAPCRHA